MALRDDLILARLELAAEFSQQDWSKALLEGWRNGLSLAWFLCRAGGVDNVFPIPSDTWDAMERRAATLVPPLLKYTIKKQPVRVWIANHATYANDALWEGDYEKALRLFAKGGCRGDHRTNARRAARAAEKESKKGRLVIRARERDKRTDWGTVK